MEKQEKIELIKRKLVNVYSIEEFDKKMNSGEKLVIKFGADPSRPDLHLGHSVVLRALKTFQELGHEIVFLIGDYTGMIGDPSGKSKTRIALTYEQTRSAGETYLKQVIKILDKDKTRIEYNSTWLKKLEFKDLINLCSKYTLARLLERDDFKKRFESNTPISIHELLYPLMQAYDSVALKCDIEVGGTDQTFNLLVGREIQSDYNQERQIVITFPLLVGLDGKEKMSKSLDNYIGIDEEAFSMYEKCMRIKDNTLKDYFLLTTDLNTKEIEEIMENDIVEAHRIYAKTIVTMYHNEEMYEDAKNRYETISKKGIPTNIEEKTIELKNINICDLLLEIGFATSKSDARRKIQEKAIKIDGELITEVDKTIEISEGKIVSFGKNKYIKVVNK